MIVLTRPKPASAKEAVPNGPHSAFMLTVNRANLIWVIDSRQTARKQVAAK